MEKIKKFFKQFFLHFKAMFPYILRGALLACVVTLLISLFVLHLNEKKSTVTASAVTQGTTPYPTPEDLTNSRWLFGTVNLTGSTSNWAVYGTFSWDNSTYSNANTNFSRVRIFSDGTLEFWTDSTANQTLSNLSAIYRPSLGAWHIYAGFNSNNEGILVSSTEYLIFTFTGGGSINSSGFRSLVANNGAYMPSNSIYIYQDGIAYIYDTSAVTSYGDLVRGYPSDFSYLTTATQSVNPSIAPIVHTPTSSVLLRYTSTSGQFPSYQYTLSSPNADLVPWLNGRVDTIATGPVYSLLYDSYTAGVSSGNGFDPFAGISSMVSSALQMEIFPNFRLYYILLIGFGVGLLGFFERMFLG